MSCLVSHFLCVFLALCFSSSLPPWPKTLCDLTGLQVLSQYDADFWTEILRVMQLFNLFMSHETTNTYIITTRTWTTCLWVSACVKHWHSNNDIQKAANKPAVNQRRFSSDISTCIPLFLKDALVGRQVCFSIPYFHSYAFLPLLSVTKDKTMVICIQWMFCFLVHL